MLLNTANLPPGHRVISEREYIFSNQTLFVVISDVELFFIVKKPSPYPGKEDEPGGIFVYQTEFPLEAASWIVDVIENRIWKSDAEGGLPSGVNFVDEYVAGENLKIRRSMNVSGPGEKGFFFINFSRPNLRFKAKDFQEIQITDTLLLEGGLMDVLKKI